MKTKFFMTLVIILMSVCSPLQAGQPDKVKREKKERAFPSEQMINELKMPILNLK